MGEVFELSLAETEPDRHQPAIARCQIFVHNKCGKVILAFSNIANDIADEIQVMLKVSSGMLGGCE